MTKQYKILSVLDSCIVTDEKAGTRETVYMYTLDSRRVKYVVSTGYRIGDKLRAGEKIYTDPKEAFAKFYGLHGEFH
jgi:hypothetical protein